MRISTPFFVALASIEHTKPTVFTVGGYHVTGSFCVGIIRIDHGAAAVYFVSMPVGT
jgi:hypothetical protein